jgi:hypothetical protein
MLIYWLLLIFPICCIILNIDKTKYNFIFVIIYGLFLTIIIGLRHNVGADWILYIDGLNSYKNSSLLEGIIKGGDVLYGLLSWITAKINGDIYLVNLICAIVFVSGLMIFTNNSPNQWLALAISIPYLVIVVAMGYTRQGAAIGLTMIALVEMEKNNFFRFGIWIILAALFHKSAIILLPLILITAKTNWKQIFGVILISFLGFFVLLSDFIDTLITGYLISNEYHSSGAGIRIVMNAVPAFLFLFFNKRFSLNSIQRHFWVNMSKISILLLFLLFISPSSTAVDRIALYWIPLQMFVLTRLPIVLTKNKSDQNHWNYLIILYILIVQYVWLFHAEHKHAWLPYQFFPIEWLIKNIF